ncbi:hypothetical protein MKX03_017688 [Papaver bracteatum]|nr:hypothetical protein MKX03_017688 [Papaver bracteatum]
MSATIASAASTPTLSHLAQSPWSGYIPQGQTVSNSLGTAAVVLGSSTAAATTLALAHIGGQELTLFGQREQQKSPHPQKPPVQQFESVTITVASTCYLPKRVLRHSKLDPTANASPATVATTFVKFTVPGIWFRWSSNCSHVDVGLGDHLKLQYLGDS